MNSTVAQQRSIKRQDNPDNDAGVLIDLTLKGDGIWTSVYTLDISVGTPSVTFPILIDTGSSDFWIASSSCGTSSCKQSKQPLWDAEVSTSHVAANQNFNLPYLQGSVEGPIYWDTITIGGYQIPNQAIAAATSVAEEPLSIGFSGLLGLSLPRNSVISQLLPPGTSDAPDGAPLTANLFGLPNAPTNHYFTLSLSRPGFDDRQRSWHAWPSRLGLGRHVPEVVNALNQLQSATTSANHQARSGSTAVRRQDDGDPKQLAYAQILPTGVGYLYWRTQVSEIIVVDSKGVEQSINLSRSVVDGGASGSLWPVAVLDTGGSSILMRSDLANALYGALNIGPASDGTYYVPCKTPLTISITLGSLRLPLHPLDMTMHPSNDPSSISCVGAIQVNPALDAGKLPGDIILGVPFLRNVYVLHDLGSADGLSRNPRFGIAALTNATLAAVEFDNVRVKNLNPDGSRNDNHGNNGNGNMGPMDHPTGKGKSTAIKIAVGVLGFLAICGLLFVVWWWLMRRRILQDRRKEEKLGHARTASGLHRVLLLANEGKQVKVQDKKNFVQRLFARRGYEGVQATGESMEMTEDELRMQRWEAYKRRRDQEERDSMWSQSTRVGVRDTLVDDTAVYEHKAGKGYDEFGGILDPLNEQRGRQLKDDDLDSSGSARSRTLSPGGGNMAIESSLKGKRSFSNERSYVPFSSDHNLPNVPFAQSNVPQRTPPHIRPPLAVEPNLSPLTEAADSQLVTPVSTAPGHSLLSRSAHLRSSIPSLESVGEVNGVDDFGVQAVAQPASSLNRPSINRSIPATPNSTLHSAPAGPRPMQRTRNPYRKSFPTSTAAVEGTQSTQAGEPLSLISPSTASLGPTTPPTPGGTGLMGPPGLASSYSAPLDPAQWTSAPSASWPWTEPQDHTQISLPPVPQPLMFRPTHHPSDPTTYPLPSAALPPGAAPPMTRRQSSDVLSPSSVPSSPGFTIPLLSSRAFSSPPSTPPAHALTRTVSATALATALSQENHNIPSVVPPTPTDDPTTPAVISSLAPRMQPPSGDALANLTVASGDGGNLNTPIMSPITPSSTFSEDGHSVDVSVRRW